MEITSLKLIKDGYGGATVRYIDPFMSQDQTINTNDNKEWTRKIPISMQMRKDLIKLRYFFLSYSGLWCGYYNEILNDENYLLSKPKKKDQVLEYIFDLWNSIDVIKIDKTDKGIKLHAEVNTKIDDMFINFQTPWIKEEHDPHSYVDCEEIVDRVFSSSVEFFVSNDLQLPEPKEFLSGYFRNDPSKLQEIEAMSDEEQMKWAIDVIEKKNGGIVITTDDVSAIPIGDSREVHDKSNGSVNPDLYQEGQEIESEKKEDKEKEKKKKEKKEDSSTLKQYVPDEDEEEEEEKKPESTEDGKIGSLENIIEDKEEETKEPKKDKKDSGEKKVVW